MDNLRALAYLEMLGAGSPLDYTLASGTGGSGDGTAGDAPSQPGQRGDGGTVPGQAPPEFAAKVNLTVPLATLLGLAERPGMLSRTGPIDPALARTLAAAAARNPNSTWCITVTGTDHRPVAHGCGRPPPRNRGRGKPVPPQQGEPSAWLLEGVGTGLAK